MKKTILKLLVFLLVSFSTFYQLNAKTLVLETSNLSSLNRNKTELREDALISNTKKEYYKTITAETNDLYVTVSNGGFINPILPGFKINVYNNEGTYNVTQISDNQLAVPFLAIPYGEYSYTISKDSQCYETITGTITIDANGGTEESIYVVPVKRTSNSIFFFIGNVQEPDCTINLTNGSTYNETMVGTGVLGDYEFTNVPYGNYTYSISKSCYETITGSVTSVCDNNNGNGVFIDNLTPSIDTSVTQVANILTANAADQTYQWIDCSTFSPIDGATNQTFTATTNGDYAVTFICGSSTIYSSCYNVSNLAVSKNTKDIFSIYPNPVQHDLSINLSGFYKTTTVEITNMIGQSIFCDKYFDSNKINLNVSKFNAGIYFININADNNILTKRFIKN